jgi:hypothetical protein
MLGTDQNDYVQCNNCSGLFLNGKFELHNKICANYIFNYEDNLTLTKDQKSNPNVTITSSNSDILSIHSNVKSTMDIKPYTKEELLDIENKTKKWVKDGALDCSICKKNFNINQIESHEIQCRKTYFEKENPKLVAILLNFTEYPEDWSKGMTENLRLDDIDPMHIEYQRIEIRFMKSVQKQIVKIERIQNKNLWDRYLREKNKIIAEKGTVSERFLWHGCKGAPPSYINNNGFDISFANDGGMFGRGNYFANRAAYSCPAYCYHDAQKGVSYVFLAKVLTGVYKVLGSGSGFKKAPFWDEKRMIYYDSVTNTEPEEGNEDKDQMFVVYENDKAYPYYLITYK